MAVASYLRAVAVRLIALSLNSAAYTTQLFYGAIRAIPDGQWQSCSALGMSKGYSGDPAAVRL